MKITSVLSKLITEDARFQVLYKKYVLPSEKRKKGILPFELVKQIIFADPTTRFPENYDIAGASVEDITSDKVKVGKYSQWMLNIFVKPNLTNQAGEPLEIGSDEYKTKASEYRRLYMEDLTHFKELLSKYDRFKGSLVDASKKDINNVKSFNELMGLPIKVGEETVELDLYRGKKVKKEKGVEVNTNFKFPGSEILKVGSEYTLIRISDKGELGSKAASYFGGYGKGMDRGETSWCTGAEGSTWSHSYRQDGPLYIFIANNDNGKVGEFTGLPSDRYQIHFPSNQFRNPNQLGGNIPIVEYLNGKWSEFKEIFKPEFAKGFIKPNSDTVEVKYPNDSTGTFVALYGFDELFESLPDTIKRINLINTGNENINLEIPSSISKFKSLTAILFANMVSSIPESICELQDLVFLALPDNRELKTIPSCIINLPKLTFFNVNRCPNVVVPKEFEQYLDEDGFYHLDV